MVILGSLSLGHSRTIVWVSYLHLMGLSITFKLCIMRLPSLPLQGLVILTMLRTNNANEMPKTISIDAPYMLHLCCQRS